MRTLFNLISRLPVVGAASVVLSQLAQEASGAMFVVFF